MLVPGIPHPVHYCPNFITEDDEQEILSHVYAAPKPKWTCLTNRRLQNWGGNPHPKWTIHVPLPMWLQKYMDKTRDFFPNDPNHCLVNEYLPGQGILPHTDGPLYYPVVCTISTGSHTVLNFHRGMLDTSIAHSLLLERRSLVVVTEEMYCNYRHSITEQIEDIIGDEANLKLLGEPVTPGDVLTRGTRVSLTIRHVLNMKPLKLLPLSKHL